jgi:thiamine transport system substrate-binding protein
MKKIILALFLISLSLSAKENLTVYIPDSMGWIAESIVPFEEANDVEVKLIKFEAANSIVSRMMLEKINPKADVVMGLSLTNVGVAKKNNLIKAYKASNIENINNNYIDDENYATLFDYGGLAIIYDSETMLNPPKTFEDITKLKDVLIIQDPRTSSTGQDFLLWTIALYGDNWKEFWKKLTPAIKSITPGWSEAFGKLMAEEAPMMVSYASNEAYSYEYYGGTKYLTIIPQEGGYLQVEGTALVNKKNIKDMSKKFIDFTISKGLQKDIALNNWMLPALEVELPDSFQYYKTSNNYLSIDSEKIDENLEVWLEEWEKIVLN